MLRADCHADRIFLCAETQNVLGWHLGYGDRPGDVNRNLGAALIMAA
jgi:hypothetical protein